MADNVTVDNGSGTDYAVSTDEGSGGHVQRVKLAYSADGSEVHVPADVDGLLVNLGGNNDVTVAGVATAANQTTVIGHLDGVEGLLTTIDADTGSLPGIATSVDGIEALLTTIDADTSNLSVVGGGTEATAQRVTIASDSTGVLSVDDNGSTLSVDDGAGSLTVDAPVATPVFVRLSDGSAAIATLPVSLASVPSHAVTNAGTFATQVTSISAGDNNIGNVDVVTLPALPAGTNNIGDVDVLTLPNVTLAAGTNTNEVVGDVAEDQPLAGNPVRVGGRASAARPTAMSGDGDIVSPWYDRAGALHTVPGAATTATLSSVSSSATSVSVLASNTSRKGVIIHNNSTQILYVKYGATATASTGGYSYKIPADATWEMPSPIYTGAIDGIWASANGGAAVTELT